MIRVGVAGILLALAFWIAGSAASRPAEFASFGPFFVDPSEPRIALLIGEITPTSDSDFERLLRAFPKVAALGLVSPGGNVRAALLIASAVFDRGLRTLVPDDAECASACAYIFFAGRPRRADGRLGVHQIFGESADAEGVQITLSYVIELLNRFGTPPEVITLMLRTPPNSMYFFSKAEVAGYGIDLDAGPLTPQQATAPLSGRRVAIFGGLDFFGADIGMERAETFVACAIKCFGASQCRAFTFNADRRQTRGPNCFLKAGTGTPDGNRVALSGMVLRPGEPNPQPFVVGRIDPEDDVLENLDYPGFDLSSRPLSSRKARFHAGWHV